MHLHFERSAFTRADSTVQALSWMGKVPDELPEDEGWRLSRLNYYQDGWLASGNVKGIVGVTFTTCHCRRTSDQPSRTNYNMRGHRSEVTLVKWNEPYQKLASCDSSGIIFVWIKYEGRWSIELINDRNTKVTDFAWSHDGRMALICYQDGFVLVGSVAGQRYWSSMMNLDATISCGVWTPDDQQVLFGTSKGQILVNDVHGELVTQVSVIKDTPIIAMAWSCEKFKMEESELDGQQANSSENQTGYGVILAVGFESGIIYLMKNYDDLNPIVLHTGLKGIKLEWSNSGQTLAVAGVAEDISCPSFRNLVKFYVADTGSLRFVAPIPYTLKPVTALTWGHNDKRLFVATGNVIHIAWVTRRMASLQLLSRLSIQRALHNEAQVARLQLPTRLRALVTNLFGQTIKGYLPAPDRLREFVSKPPANNIRLHCTVVRHDDDVAAGSATYTLFLEYLGGLVPLLKGRRASKLRPEFVIFDPQADSRGSASSQATPNVSQRCTPTVSSDSELDEGCASPRLQRRRRFRKQLLSSGLLGGSMTNSKPESRESSQQRKENAYVDLLPETSKLLAITSNIWGTKFKLIGLVDWLPAVLGMMSYRTSLLHLQPRQMTLMIKELQGPRPHSNTRLRTKSGIQNTPSFSEDDDDLISTDTSGLGSERTESPPPIAPMTPKKQRCALTYEQIAAHDPELDGDHEPTTAEEVLSFTTTQNSPNTLQISLRYRPSASAPSQIQSVATQTSLHCLYDLLSTKAAGSSAGPSRDTSPVAGPSRLSCGATEHSSGVATPTGACSCRKPPRSSFNGTSPTRKVMKRNSRVDPDQSSPVEEVPHSTTSEIVRAVHTPEPRWAEKASDIKYIDNEEDNSNVAASDESRAPANGQASVENVVTIRDASIRRMRSDTTKRLTLRSARSPPSPSNAENGETGTSVETKECLIDDPGCCCEACQASDDEGSATRSCNSPLLQRFRNDSDGNVTPRTDTSMLSSCSLLSSLSSATSASFLENAVVRNEQDISRGLPPPASPPVSRSTPTTPDLNNRRKDKKQSTNHLKALLYSPLLLRRVRKQSLRSTLESSDDENTTPAGSSENLISNNGFRDLESMQKAYIKKKLKKRHGKVHQQEMLINSKQEKEARQAQPAPVYREFILHNKAPLWNDASQVYQLDFGGRVTQESAKNFQIEFKGSQVMQFGRIDGNAYTLDFQYPFTALQAFAVALANVTQRLK